MATSTTGYLKAAVKGAINRIKNLRTNKPDVANGVFLLTGYKDVVAADYDVVGDVIELFEFPSQTYLLGASVVANKEYDTGGSALRTDLILSDSTVSSFTSAVGTAFAAQTSNEAVEVISDAAGDTTQTITIIGTTTGTDTVVVETVTLNGTSQVTTTKTDWGLILAAFVATGTLTAASTVTIREASGNATITTLTPASPSKGVQTVTPTSFYGRLANLVASGSSTKQIGLKGTDNDGTVIYDSQALTGTTVAQSNLAFTTITQIYTGDLESNRTVTLSSGKQTLVSASQAFTSLAVPLNFNGASIDNSEFGMSVASQKLALRIAVAPTTANTGTVRFNYKVLVYHGVDSVVVS